MPCDGGQSRVFVAVAVAVAVVAVFGAVGVFSGCVSGVSGMFDERLWWRWNLKRRRVSRGGRSSGDRLTWLVVKSSDS